MTISIELIRSWDQKAVKEHPERADAAQFQSYLKTLFAQAVQYGASQENKRLRKKAETRMSAMDFERLFGE